MAHAFDTGLSRPQRTLIRSGIVTLLSGLLRSNGGYLAAVIPWAGVVRGYTDVDGVDELKKALQGRAPAIAVALGDRVSEAAGMGGFNWKGAIEVSLYHYANHQSSITEGRTSSNAAALASDVLDPGLDVMLEHAEELLVGQSVGGALVTNPIGERTRKAPTIHRITPTREEELLTDPTHTLWVQRYAVQVDRKIDRYRGVTELLEEIRTHVRPSEVTETVAELAADGPGDRVIESQSLPTVP
jgi:hypothetical protein